MQSNATDQIENELSEEKNNEYHCNYCKTPLSGQRIKCAVCVDFELCTTCFAVGVEIAGHKKDHCFRLYGAVDEHLLAPNWNIEEELDLLEGICLFGYGSWEDISEHVGSKDAKDCEEHYIRTFLDDPECSAYVAAGLYGPGASSSSNSSSCSAGGHNNGNGSTKDVKNEGTGARSSRSASTTSSNGNSKSGKRYSLTCCPVHENFKSQEKPPLVPSEYGYNYCRKEFEGDKDCELNAESLVCGWEGLSKAHAKRRVQSTMLGVYDRKLCERYRRRRFVETWGMYNKKGLQVMDKRQRENPIWAEYMPMCRLMTKEDFNQLIAGFEQEQQLRAQITDLQKQLEARAQTGAQSEYRDVTDLFTDRPQRLSSARVRKKASACGERPPPPLSEIESTHCMQTGISAGQYLMQKDVHLRTALLSELLQAHTEPQASAQPSFPQACCTDATSSDISSDTPPQNDAHSPCDISEGGKQSDSDISMNSEPPGGPAAISPPGTLTGAHSAPAVKRSMEGRGPECQVKLGHGFEDIPAAKKRKV